MSAHKKYEQQLKETSNKVFSELPEAQREAAAASRSQLLDWLINMDRATKNAAEVITDDMANTACNAFQHFTSADETHAAVLTAFSALTEQAQLDLMRNVLGATVVRHVSNVALMTRANDIFLWENTGFHLDGDIGTVFAKLGREKYQPIGFDDGTHYVGTEGSKTLWSRQFGMALIFPHAPAFEIAKHEIQAKSAYDAALSDKEREKITEVIGWFEEDLKAHADLKSDDIESLKALEDKVRETLKLARVRLPRLDERIDKMVEESPEVGDNLENLEPVQVAVACCEFLRMKLDDDTVRRQVEGTSLSVKSLQEVRTGLLSSLIDGMDEELNKANPDMQILSRRVHEAAVSFPEVRDALSSLDDEAQVLEVATRVRELLQQEFTSTRAIADN